jgi:hypothetical protein
VSPLPSTELKREDNMSKKYLQIITFSILFCCAAAQDARGGRAECCNDCITTYSRDPNYATIAKHPGYSKCIKGCMGTACPLVGLPAVITSCCGRCIMKNLVNKKIDSRDGMPYRLCIKQCTDMCQMRPLTTGHIII